jgi:hypothetical protein
VRACVRACLCQLDARESENVATQQEAGKGAFSSSLKGGWVGGCEKVTHEVEAEEGAGLLYHLGVGALLGGVGGRGAGDRLRSRPDPDDAALKSPGGPGPGRLLGLLLAKAPGDAHLRAAQRPSPSDPPPAPTRLQNKRRVNPAPILRRPLVAT